MMVSGCTQGLGPWEMRPLRDGAGCHSTVVQVQISTPVGSVLAKAPFGGASAEITPERVIPTRRDRYDVSSTDTHICDGSNQYEESDIVYRDTY